MSTEKVQFLKDVKWDNWGRFVTVFREGDVVQATRHNSGEYTAESPYWPGISDYIHPDDFMVIT